MSNSKGVPVTVQREMQLRIIEIAKNQFGLGNSDIANLLAIASVESTFDPNAHNQKNGSTASGLFQVELDTAKDDYEYNVGGEHAGRRKSLGIQNISLPALTTTNKTWANWYGHNKPKSFTELKTWNAFDIDTNIMYGIVTYLVKKHDAGANATVAQIYAKYNPNATPNGSDKATLAKEAEGHKEAEGQALHFTFHPSTSASSAMLPSLCGYHR
jgi:hypothetical protein